MHLWQIRHIPNDRQTLHRLTAIALGLGLVAVTSLFSMSFVAAQTAGADPNVSTTAGNAIPAEDFLERVRQELPKHQSIKADLLQLVSIGEQNFKITGDYLSSGSRLKLNYEVAPDQGAKGSMLEVCDGKELWTMLTLADRTEVTQRNIQQILAAAATANPKNVAETTMKAELGLGGITALLASLGRTMNFDAIKVDEADGQSHTIVQGRWKDEVLQVQRLPKDPGEALPPYVPEIVRISVNTKTLFPEKIWYLKKIAGKKTFKSLVMLEFRNVEFDVPVDDATFVFQVPTGVIPSDITGQYLQRLIPPPATPAAAAAPAAN